MRTKRQRLLVVAIAALMTVAGCSDPVAPPSPTPVTPTITETFSGTLTVGGSNTHSFTVNAVGGLQVTLVSVDPPAAVKLSVGQPSGPVCPPIDSLTTVSGPSTQMTGTATVTGNFCIAVTDAGNLVEPVNYVVTVLHS